MIIDGTHVERKTIKVDVDPRAVVDKLRCFWLAWIGHNGQYINNEGVWEDWDDTGHGSGLYTRFGNATEDEIAMMNAFKSVSAVAKSVNDRQ